MTPTERPTMNALGALLRCQTLLEPEESTWPPAVKERALCGYFSGFMWFRATRVPLIYKADQLRAQGQCVLLDSYYDKVVMCYLGKPGME